MSDCSLLETIDLLLLYDVVHPDLPRIWSAGQSRWNEHAKHFVWYYCRCVNTGIKPAMREMEENRVNFIVYFMVHIVRQTEVLKDIVIMCHDDIY